MLVELVVRDLGVLSEARIPLGEGMTALTGETGAGKTMVVDALHLLSGGRADPSRVRPGADEAVVEGLFVAGDTEWALRRVVPASGRSRCYVNGELSTAASLAEITAPLLEIHGQHAQQALLSAPQQRQALDQFAGVDRSGMDVVRGEVRRLESELSALGGDERARRRQVDLLSHQVDEIAAVQPRPGEPGELADLEDRLADAVAHRAAGEEALDLLGADDGVTDVLARAVAALEGRAPFDEVARRLRALLEDLVDATGELRRVGEGVEPDDERLAEVRARRQTLVELFRKYGDGPEQVLRFAEEAAEELAELNGLDGRRAATTTRLEQARTALHEEAVRVGTARRAAVPQLEARLGEVLAGLALPAAQVSVEVADTDALAGAGEAVELRISTNPGMPPGPLARVASGGELSRVMLALRLVLSGGPDTMVFDEVDAGVGGTAATAVAGALAQLSVGRQVLVVTHLPQVAAVAHHQVVVEKRGSDGATTTVLRHLDSDERVVEVSRMLSGSPGSESARAHAEELLGTAHGGGR